MERFIFFQRWLLVVSFIICTFGLLMSFLSGTILFSFFNEQINSVFWNTATVSPEIQRFQLWIYGVLGAVMLGWGIFSAFIAYYPFKQKEKWSWLCVAAGVTVWFLIDTTLSLYYGVIVNALLNISIFISIIIPLLFTWKDFFE